MPLLAALLRDPGPTMTMHARFPADNRLAWRLILGAFVISLASLAIVQLASGVSLSSVFGDLVFLAFYFLGAIAAGYLIWRRRWWPATALVVALIAYDVAAFAWLPFREELFLERIWTGAGWFLAVTGALFLLQHLGILKGNDPERPRNS